MPVGLKLLALVFVLAMLTIRLNIWWLAPTRLLVVLALYIVASFSIKDFLNQLWRIRWLVLFVLVPALVFTELTRALNGTTALVCGLLLATLVTMTTKTSDIVALIERLTRSRSLALLIALSLNSVTLVTGYAQQIIEASKARGVKPKPIRQIINLFVISLRNADQYGEALTARGVEN